MRFKVSAIGMAAAVMLSVVPAAIGSSAQRVGAYDFSYMTSGELRATPVQVFDDGKNTYFQFRAGEPIPAIFQNRDNTVQLVVPTFEGPYVKVAEVAARYTLQLGKAQAQVFYSADGRAGAARISAVGLDGGRTPYKLGYPADPSAKLVASLGPALALMNNTSLEANSYATPVKGDQVTWKDSDVRTEEVRVWFGRGQHWLSAGQQKDLAAVGARVKTATSIVIIGRDDDSYKEGLETARAKTLQAALIKSGVPASVITLKTGVAGEPVKGQWNSDIRIETVVPTQVARRDPAPEPSAQVRANIDGLLRAKLITEEQAHAMLRQSMAPGAQETAAQPAKPPVAEKPKNLEVPPTGFDLRASDKTIAATVRRWAQATNYQVVWDAPQASDAALNGDAVIAAASMKEALEKVVGSLQRKGYDLQATIYSNRVIRFTASTK